MLLVGLRYYSSRLSLAVLLACLFVRELPVSVTSVICSFTGPTLRVLTPTWASLYNRFMAASERGLFRINMYATVLQEVAPV